MARRRRAGEGGILEFRPRDVEASAKLLEVLREKNCAIETLPKSEPDDEDKRGNERKRVRKLGVKEEEGEEFEGKRRCG